MKSHEDFFLLILYAHIIVAANNCIKCTSSQTAGLSTEVSKQIVSKWVRFALPAEEPLTSLSHNDETSVLEPPLAGLSPEAPPSDVEMSSDIEDEMESETEMETDPEDTSEPGSGTVNSYAVDILSLGLLWHGFKDATKEGDGDRVILYYKFLLPIFRSLKRRNYCIKAFRLLAQTVVLSPHKVADIKWNRTINVHGKSGKNIPVDLHMEHLNRRLKKAIRSIGSNVHPMAIQRAAKSLGPISTVMDQFEQETDLVENKDYHTIPSFARDLKTVIDILEGEEVFSESNLNNHRTYGKKPLLQNMKWDDVKAWLHQKIIELDTYSMT